MTACPFVRAFDCEKAPALARHPPCENLRQASTSSGRGTFLPGNFLQTGPTESAVTSAVKLTEHDVDGLPGGANFTEALQLASLKEQRLVGDSKAQQHASGGAY